MRVVTNTSFRCELCGKFRQVGVTENPEPPPKTDEEPEPEEEVDRTYVCVHCVVKAEQLLAEKVLGITTTASDWDEALKAAGGDDD